MVPFNSAIFLAALLLINVFSSNSFLTPHFRFNRCHGVVQCEVRVADSASSIITEAVSFMEIRIGKIIEIGLHPEAENLYVEKVDCGEDSGPRTIVSGLAKYCTLDELMGRNVVVLANLKPRALVGIMSAGMLLCASNEDHTKAS